MRATIHLTDGGALAGLRSVMRKPFPTGTVGLIEARALTAAPLRDTRAPRPQLGRVATLAFWEDDAAIDAYEADHPELSSGGWSARLEPIRAVSVAGGHFPGVPGDPPRGAADFDGPVLVLTIAKVRKRRIVPFLRASGKAEEQTAAADGHLWSSGVANIAQGVVATLSLWESGAAAHAYAIGTSGHQAALGHEAKQSFHHAGSFVRFRPYRLSGELGGRNPLPAEVTKRLGDATT